MSNDNNTNHAQTFIVDSLEDIIDPDDGVTTLREAINAANNQSGQDTTVFNLALGSVIQLTGQLDITDDLIINGPGAENLTISGDNTFNNFFIDNVNVVLDGLTIANGDDSITVGSNNTLTVTNSVLINNADDGIDVIGDGNTISLFGVTSTGNGEHGVHIDGINNTFTAINSSIIGNGDDGLTLEQGDGNNSVTLIDSLLGSNTGDGIGVSTDSNTINLFGVTVIDNAEDGVEIDGNGNFVTVINSTFSNNGGEAIADRGNDNVVNAIDSIFLGFTNELGEGQLIPDFNPEDNLLALNTQDQLEFSGI